MNSMVLSEGREGSPKSEKTGEEKGSNGFWESDGKTTGRTDGTQLSPRRGSEVRGKRRKWRRRKRLIFWEQRTVKAWTGSEALWTGSEAEMVSVGSSGAVVKGERGPKHRRPVRTLTLSQHEGEERPPGHHRRRVELGKGVAQGVCERGRQTEREKEEKGGGEDPKDGEDGRSAGGRRSSHPEGPVGGRGERREVSGGGLTGWRALRGLGLGHQVLCRAALAGHGAVAASPSGGSCRRHRTRGQRETQWG